MIKYLQLPFQFDAKQMQEELQQLNQFNWQLHYQKLQYEGNWSALPLRSDGGQVDNIIISPGNTPDYQDTLLLQQCPYFQSVLSTFSCPLQAVRLLKLSPGASIREHRDAELNYEKGEIRIHIPVSTNDKVEFLLDGEPMHLQPGTSWYMNFNLPHALANHGSEDRIHLVIDALVNDWVHELFAQPGLLKKEIEETGPDPAIQRKIIEQLRAMNTEKGNQLADEMEAALADRIK